MTDPAVQRQVAIYSALIRYEEGVLGDSPTSTSGAGPIYMLSQLFTEPPTAPGTFVAAGTLAAAVEHALSSALANDDVHVVPDDQAVPKPSCGAAGHEYELRIGPVPAAGDVVQVYLVETDLAVDQRTAAMYTLSLEGSTWSVTPMGIGSSLGSCG